MTIPESTNATPAGQEVERLAWRCYHCGEVFTDDRCARLHFGRDEDSAPACRIKAGAEQGLLGALRDAEYAAADAMQAVANECTDAAKAYYAQATRHASALRNAEEAGYERGLADGRALATPSVATPANDAGMRAPYLSDRFEWAAPGDQQEDAWIVRFCDHDVRDALYTGPTAEAEARAAWERHAPGYNMYLFRLARLAASPKAPSVAGEPCGYCGRDRCRCDAADLCEAPGCDNRTYRGICAACDKWVTDQVATTANREPCPGCDDTGTTYNDEVCPVCQTEAPSVAIGAREAITAAIKEADDAFGYSYRLTKIDDSGEEHTLVMDGHEPTVFADREDGYPVIEQRRNASRAARILAALNPASASIPADVAQAIAQLRMWEDETPIYAGDDPRSEYYRQRRTTIGLAIAALAARPC